MAVSLVDHAGVLAGAVLLVLVVQGFARGEILRFDFDGDLVGLIGGLETTASLLPGARFVESVEGQGIEAGQEGFAVEIPVADKLTLPAGTLAFRFRLSRRDVFDPKVPYKITFLECPALRIEYSAAKLYLSVPAARQKLEPHRIQFTHFKARRWYHLAVTWDAERGTIFVYLNGVLQEYPPRTPWRLRKQAGPLRMGGAYGDLKIAVDSLQAFETALTAQQIAELLKARPVDPPDYEGRMEFAGSLDLAGWRKQLIYEADFTRPLSLVSEDQLFDGEKRLAVPDGADWVLEGPGSAWTQNGRLHIKHAGPDDSVVLWSNRTFPGDFLLEFGFVPSDPQRGLTIIFFCATGQDGGSIFAADQPRRDGYFPSYHSGKLRCYHVSYWATAPDGVGYRGTSNLRKDPGHHLVAIGNDNIAGAGAGPHTVRLCKTGSKIQLETNGKLAVVWSDEGQLLGPAYGEGYIALRQMRHTRAASYTYFRVWRLTRGSKHATSQP